MSLKIELSKDVELALRQQAQQAGEALNQYIARILKEKTNLVAKISNLSVNESQLLGIINRGFDETFWHRLRTLNEKRKAGEMLEFSTEHKELIAMTEQLEALNVTRTKALIELAALRQTDFVSLSHQLGVNNVSYL